MNLSIDAKSPLPVYQQVIQAIKLEILSGRLRDDDTLPSIRDLAKLLKLIPNTVAKAYYALEEYGSGLSSPTFRIADMTVDRKGSGRMDGSAE